MARMRIRWQMVPAAALLALTACSGGGKKEAGKQPQTFNPVAAAMSAGKEAPSAMPDGAPKLVRTPAHPTVLDNLQAQVENGPGSAVFSWEINETPVDGQSGNVLPAGTAHKGDQVTVSTEVGGKTVTAEATIVDSPPKVTALKFQDAHIHRGEDIVILPQASDPDDDPVSFRYRWTLNGEELANDSSTLPGDAFHKGDKISLQVTPDDGEKEGLVFQSAVFTVPDAPPACVSAPPQKFQGREYSYAARADDSDGDEVTYALEGAPAGMTIDPHSGQVQWAITAAAAGTQRIKVTASDPDGMKAVQEYDLTVNIPK